MFQCFNFSWLLYHHHGQILHHLLQFTFWPLGGSIDLWCDFLNLCCANAHIFNTRHSKCLSGPQHEVLWWVGGSVMLLGKTSGWHGACLSQSPRSISLTDSCLNAKGEGPNLLPHTYSRVSSHWHFCVSPVYIKPLCWLIQCPYCCCEMPVMDCSGAYDLLLVLYRSLRSLLAVIGLN